MQSSARELTNRLLAAAGLEVRKKPRALIRSGHELHVTLQMIAAELTMTDQRPLSVLQVGAFDGVANDPVYELLRRHGWPAVLCEPQPSAFARLARTHAANPAVQVFNVAIAAADGQQVMYALQAADDLPAWASQIASFNRDHLVAQQRWLPQTSSARDIRPFEVTTMTFETLLATASLERVDILHLDAEGYDLDLLKLFDVPRRLPSIVGYEHQHLSRKKREEAVAILTRSGYSISMSYLEGDTVGYRRSGL